MPTSRRSNNVGAYAAKTNFSTLLERVEAGEEITITRHGSPVARMVPVKHKTTPERRRAAIEAMRKLAEGTSLPDISVPPRRIDEIVRGQPSITADTALRLARFFRTSDRFWLNLQTRHDLEVEKDRLGDRLDREVVLEQDEFLGHLELGEPLEGLDRLRVQIERLAQLMGCHQG